MMAPFHPRFTIIALSDLHLVPPGERLAGLDPAARFDAAIARINQAYADADLVLLVGDLVNRRAAGAYPLLAKRLEGLTVPWAATLGNHDDRAAFRVLFPDHIAEDGYAHAVYDVAGVRVILLDSLEGDGSVGHLCEARYAWFDRALAEAKGRPVIVALHHPPVALGIRGDAYSLAEPERFFDRLEAHGDVRLVLSGHVHMTSTTLVRGISCATIAGGHTTSTEAFGRPGSGIKVRRAGPAVMGVVLGDRAQVTVHVESYDDVHTVTGEVP